MNKIEKEYSQILDENSWGLIYQKLGQQCQKYACIEARKPQNRPLNRYRDVSPYDHSRIILQRIDNGYINANLVQLPQANRKYILTQGPLAFTVSHFWLMVWEQNCPAILMLNKVIEKCEVKCHFYWPHGVGEEHKVHFNDVQLTVEQISEENLENYTIRNIRIHDLVSKSSRDVIQFQYKTWPDFGVPTSPTAFLEFLNLVRSSGALDPKLGPPIVHCSAGIGRSGTFCLVDSCLVIIENDGPNSVDVQQVLMEMRRDRMGLIQTPDQLRFSYEAIIEGTKFFDPERTLQPNMLTTSYGSNGSDEETPPPPPLRLESLCTAPAKPLPTKPANRSMIKLDAFPIFNLSSSEKSSLSAPAHEDSDSSGDYEEDNAYDSLPSEPASEPSCELSSEPACEPAREVRRRRNRELAKRVSDMKKRAHENERWEKLKRSFYKSITITAGFLFAGILIYAYVRH